MPSRRTFLQHTLAVMPGAAMAPALITTRKSRPDEADFIQLFDGSSLDGWHTNPEKIGHGTGGRWTIEGKALVGQQDPPGSGNGGILLTDRVFSDFELLLEINPDWGVDSGLFLRANDEGQCFQMMIDYLEGGIVGHLYGEGTGGYNTRSFSLRSTKDSANRLTGFESLPYENYKEGSLSYACSPEEWLQAWRIGDWNRVRVVCVGEYPVIKTWINDQLIVDFNAALYNGAQYDREKVKAILGRAGSIAVQVHGGRNRWATGAKSRWRDIRIRPL